jgi:hypothetical protein
MKIHKFKAGDIVTVPGGPMTSTPSGKYEVVTGLPERDSEPQYRVRALSGGQEWVLKETELG